MLRFQAASSPVSASDARVRAERLDEVEGPALRERVNLGCQIGQSRLDRGVNLLVGVRGSLAQFGDGQLCAPMSPYESGAVSMTEVVLTLAISALPTAPSRARSEKFPPACSERSVKEWMNGRYGAVREPPKKPCTMLAETGISVCDQDGCQRPR